MSPPDSLHSKKQELPLLDENMTILDRNYQLVQKATFASWLHADTPAADVAPWSNLPLVTIVGLYPEILPGGSKMVAGINKVDASMKETHANRPEEWYRMSEVLYRAIGLRGMGVPYGNQDPIRKLASESYLCYYNLLGSETPVKLELANLARAYQTIRWMVLNPALLVTGWFRDVSAFEAMTETYLALASIGGVSIEDEVTRFHRQAKASVHLIYRQAGRELP